ncbi:MAG: hypothetical protein LIR50_20490 [Bacillota bacterium]|nr:hypothetical protein [Bacillota bacterium]
MKRVILSITVVIFTILSCTYMLTYKVPEKVNYNRSDIKVSKPDDASVKEKTEENVDKKDDKAAAEDTNDSGSSLPDSDINYPIVEEAKSVFKVSKNSISISSQEKLKLLLIYKKLDKDDEERITEFLNEEDEDSVKNIFHLLRDRLSDDDYQSVRNIASRFINLDVAEN